MYGTSPFFSEKDRRVRIYNNGIAVSPSAAQSQYARYINYIGNRFTVAVNTLAPNIKTYDVSLTFPDKTIPYEGGVAQGTTPGFINFDDTQFDVSALTGDQYTVTDTAWGKVLVNAFTTPRKLNVVNTTNHEAVIVAENVGADRIDMTFSNNEVDVYSNATLVTSAAPRMLNFSTDFTVTDDAANDRANIGLGGGFLPLPQNKRWGVAMGGQIDLNGSFGEGLFNLPYTSNSGDVSGINNNTHGHARRYTSGSDDNDTIEVATDFPMSQLAFNPHIYGKFGLSLLEDARVMVGFSSDAIPTGDNVYLANLSGFLLGYQYDTAETEDTNWQMIRNDGDATQDQVSAGIALTNTTPFTFEIVGEATPTPRWGWNINGGAFTYYTTEIPALNTNLNFTFRIEEIGGDEMQLDMYYLYLVQDR